MKFLKKTVLIPIEIKERELIPKCLLALELIKKGFRIYIGSTETIDRVAKQIKPSIFFHKSTYVAKSKYYKSLGHKFVFLDEEVAGAISRSRKKKVIFERYVRYVSKESNDIIFLPSIRYKKAILNYPTTKGVDFYVTGLPRIDLWKKNYNYIHNSKIKEIKKKYGNYYLFLSSFGKEIVLPDHPKNKNLNKKFFKKINMIKFKNFLNYKNLLIELSKLINKNEKIIIRPHPDEIIDHWKKLTNELRNIHVVRDGDVTPWLLASDGILQYGSTTALQSSLNGITCVQYNVKKIKGSTDTPSFELCKDASTPLEVYSLLKKYKGKKDKNLIKKTKKYLKKELEFDENKLATTKIVRVLESEAHNPAEEYVPKLYDKIRPYLQYAKNYIKFNYYKLNKYASTKKTSIDKIPGGIQKNEMKSIIKLLNKKENVKKIDCQQVCKDLVCIEKI